MKKQEEKRMVISEQTESDLKYRGVQIAFRKYWIPCLVVLLALLVGMSYANNIEDKIIRYILAGGGYFVFCLALGWSYNKVGGKYWNNIKDEKEPIKLEKMPSIWWLFKRK